MQDEAALIAQSGTPGPLAGVRIVEVDTIGPVPLAAMILADMGADVVRITRPAAGQEALDDVGGVVLYRGRTAVEIDLKSDRDAALALIERADALIEGFRPGVMERLGLGPDDCLTANPRLVYGRMTGWGQNGPLAQQAGHDVNYVGLTGALHAMGAADQPPPIPLNLIGDYAGGSMFLVSGVLAGLLSARTTGRGQVVDTAMIDGVITLTALFHAFRHTGAWSDNRAANLLDGGAPFYRCYSCADGKFIAVGPLEPRFFAQLLDGLNLSAASLSQTDRDSWPKMERQFAEIFASRPRDHWADVFAGTDACVSPVLAWHEAIAHPHNTARSSFVVHDGALQPAPAPRFSATPSAIRDARASSVHEVVARWAAPR